jgi:hypothetical protein
MNIEVRITNNFKKEVKPLLKKYPSLLSELDDLQVELLSNPKLGESLGGGAHKIRLAIKSKRKGKSGGARVITLLESEIIGFLEKDNGKTIVNLITIYDKSETENILDKELKELIKLYKKV